MNFFKLILILCMSIYMNDAKRIYLYGETHGETANNFRKEKWREYLKNEIEFLSEGCPYNPLKSQEQLDNEDQFMIENQYEFMIDNLDLLEFQINFTRSQILFFITITTSKEEYQEFKKQLQNFQKSHYDYPLVKLPYDYTTGKEKAKQLFYEHWEIFTNMTADRLHVWRDFKIDLEKDKQDNLEILHQFKMILSIFRNLHMAKVIANKYFIAINSKKDLHVHLGEDHRLPVIELLQTLYKIPEENIHSKYLKQTESDNPIENSKK